MGFGGFGENWGISHLGGIDFQLPQCINVRLKSDIRYSMQVVVTLDNINAILNNLDKFYVDTREKVCLEMLKGALEAREKFRENQASQENPEEPEVRD